MADVVLIVTGMTCAVCASTVEKALLKVEGVSDVTVNITNGKTKVIFDDNAATVELLKSAVVSAGYGISEGNSLVEDASDMLKKLIISFIFCGILFYISMGHMM